MALKKSNVFRSIAFFISGKVNTFANIIILILELFSPLSFDHKLTFNSFNKGWNPVPGYKGTSNYPRLRIQDVPVWLEGRFLWCEEWLDNVMQEENGPKISQ